MQIKGSVALVTGAVKGIGHAFCVALLENGVASVRMLDICKDEGKKVQEAFESKYGAKRAQFAECDVTNHEELAKAIKQTVADHGRLDILCNNAGIVNEKDWQKTIDINLVSVIQGTYIGMEAMNSGIIVNTASMGGLAPMSPTPVYCASKHGVIGFSRSIAPVAHKTKGIRVNCICPVFVDTPMLEKQKEDMPQVVPLIQHLGVIKPEQVAEGLLQLINDDSKNGQVMRVTATKGIDYQQYTIQGV